MSPTPPLGPRALASYRRLEIEVTALKTALHSSRLTGPVTAPTVDALEAVRRRANKLFCRHAELPFFPPLAYSGPLSQTDLAVHVHRLAAAARQFGEYHADQLGEEDWDAVDDPAGD
ncbi:MAG: hypothetical protein RLW68_00330 [Devosia marina]|uniref:hypothetical protein n=1 Tax=Devosia marina TaxID=2683198 RepID=UPI0032EAE103